MVQAAWQELGFHVAINAVEVVVNDDESPVLKEVATDIKDDIFMESFKTGKFEMVAIDYCAYSPDAFSVLAPFAKQFSGESIDMTTFDYALNPHVSGYDSAEYNELLQKAFDEKNIKNRSATLHDAEKKLIEEDMAIIPVIFNQNATLTNKGLSKVSFT